MQEHFHFTTDRAKLQKQYAAIFLFVSAQLSLIQIHLQRRNRHLVKQEDEVVIAIHLLGKLLGFSSERAWHRFVTGHLFTDGQFLERSRYNRRCRALGFALKWIRRRERTWSTPCLCRRRQYAASVVPSRENGARQTIPWDRGYGLLRFQKTIVLRIQAAPSSDQSRIAHGLCCNGSVLSRRQSSRNGHDPNSSSLQLWRQRVHQPHLATKAVRKAPSGIVDTVSKQSKTSSIPGMGRMDQEKTKRHRDGLFHSR